MAHSPARTIVLPRKIRRYQAENSDLHDIYEKKRSAMSRKHFAKSIVDVQCNIQIVVDDLEHERGANGGPWLLGNNFGCVDVVACSCLQWIVRCNEYGAAPIAIS
mmetsp:Transcript_3859/g.8808  ORF Transcript_3859/g.8808 Transcript_3859/m.8808 type:complete len:105 (+) Transcript_3859:268-582(+)|eukprot:CAMPEP_0178470020 /NCGR_PEP_ID=MMETSP0696-20121128/309_1 /TAXON_ID=265572 /ORGANISM="Extubocellulus spinifer, Strain CCMP396" /LENGTH=104 /DNA_ID=CAMNT_0020097105 /DNA_START=656 /DNA_END=970 /DNA_ORIENTATION=-